MLQPSCTFSYTSEISAIATSDHTFALYQQACTLSLCTAIGLQYALQNMPPLELSGLMQNLIICNWCKCHYKRKSLQDQRLATYYLMKTKSSSSNLTWMQILTYAVFCASATASRQISCQHKDAHVMVTAINTNQCNGSLRLPPVSLQGFYGYELSHQ